MMIYIQQVAKVYFRLNLTYGVFNLTVDRSAPMCVDVPTGVSATVAQGLPGSEVSWTEPTCVDFSGTARVTSRSHFPNSFFPVGSTDVTYICSDDSGNTESCVFTVTVVPGETLT